jgi:hypothetical protein
MVLLKKHMLNLDIAIKVLLFLILKGILNLGVKTLLIEITGQQSTQYTI